MSNTKPNELTTAADALARVVGQMLPAGIGPALAAEFRRALGDLLAATLGGATVMAAGAVVALDNKVERLANTRGEALRAVQLDLDRIAVRVHQLEDQFLDAGAVGAIQTIIARIALDVERLKERQVGDDGNG